MSGHRRTLDLIAASQGLLAVGIGDTAAAIVGVYFSGKGVSHPLPPPGLHRKTWEGKHSKNGLCLVRLLPL